MDSYEPTSESCEKARKLSPTAEKNLIQRAQDGDCKAFEELYDAYVDALKKHVESIPVNPDKRADIITRAFTNAWLRLKSFQHRSTFETWIKVIASRLWVDELRRVSRDRRFVISETELAEYTSHSATNLAKLGSTHLGIALANSPDHALMAKEVRGAVWRALENLNEKQSIVAYLRLIKEKEFKEIAEMLNIPVGTVCSRLNAAKAALKLSLYEFVTK
jgi:RNA polymerase sigma-70 factor, ECF subfamily